jgi:DNA-binding CsgD family transcriptional regulator
MPPLTLREQQVLQLMVQGSSTNKEIARALNLSPRTIEIYRYNLFRKLGVHNAADLVRKALTELPQTLVIG